MADVVRGAVEWLCSNPFQEVWCLKRAGEAGLGPPGRSQEIKVARWPLPPPRGDSFTHRQNGGRLGNAAKNRAGMKSKRLHGGRLRGPVVLQMNHNTVETVSCSPSIRSDPVLRFRLKGDWTKGNGRSSLLDRVLVLKRTSLILWGR